MTRGERKIALRCALYTRVSTTPAWSRISTPSTTSEKLLMPTLRARHMRDGSLSESDMTTGVFRAVQWSGRRSRSCWTMLRPCLLYTSDAADE